MMMLVLKRAAMLLALLVLTTACPASTEVDNAAEATVESAPPGNSQDTTSDSAEVASATPEPAQVPVPTAVPEAEPASPFSADGYTPQLVQPVGSRQLVPVSAADFSTPEAAIEEFFAAFTVGDWPIVYELLSNSARQDISAAVFTEEWRERTVFADIPSAYQAMSERAAALPRAARYAAEGFSTFEIAMEEAVARGALRLDLTLGIEDLAAAPNDSSNENEQRFEARLRSTGEQVLIDVQQSGENQWRIMRVIAPTSDDQSITFGGPRDGSSQVPDPTTQWSTYDALTLETPEATINQLEALAAQQDWHRLFLVLDSESRSHAVAAASDNPRRLFIAGDSIYDIFQPAVPRTFHDMVAYGVQNYELGVPLAGYEIVERRDEENERGEAVAILSATHAHTAGTWTITMTEQATGWHLHQIQRPGAPAERLPFSFESTIQVASPDGDASVIRISDLEPYIRATVSYLSAEQFETYWADFVSDTHQPANAYLAQAHVEQPGVFWVDWRAADSVEWSANNVAEAMGFERDFVWDYEPAIVAYQNGDTSNAPVVTGMLAFNGWLGERGYDLVGLDPGWDAYIAVAVPDEDAFVALADQTGVQTFLLAE